MESLRQRQQNLSRREGDLARRRRLPSRAAQQVHKRLNDLRERSIPRRQKPNDIKQPPLQLFVDGSVDPRTRIGYGAYLLLPPGQVPIEPAEDLLRLKRFENASSTQLELQTLLWAISEIDLRGHSVHVYADSQNIVTLGARRERLERSRFKNARGETLAHERLYRSFYHICDELDISFEKVKGHSKRDLKSAIEGVFAVVDRAARQALRRVGG